MPDFAFELCDLHQLRDQEIIGSDTLRFGLQLMKYIRARDFIVKLRMMVRQWNQPVDDAAVDEYLTAVFVYILTVADNISETDVAKVVRDSILETKGEQVMTIAEKLKKEGWQKGRQEGRQEGTLFSTRRSILQVLDIRFGSMPQEIATKLDEITDIEWLVELHRQSVVCASVNDFYAQL